MILKSVEDQGKNLNREVREFGVIRRTACLTSRKIQEKGGEEGVETHRALTIFWFSRPVYREPIVVQYCIMLIHSKNMHGNPRLQHLTLVFIIK